MLLQAWYINALQHYYARSGAMHIQSKVAIDTVVLFQSECFERSGASPSQNKTNIGIVVLLQNRAVARYVQVFLIQGLVPNVVSGTGLEIP